jgi:hypothetical protein
MVKKPMVICLIAPISVVGILMLAILAAILSTNQAFAYSSYYKGYYKNHHDYYKSYRRPGYIQVNTQRGSSNANTVDDNSKRVNTPLNSGNTANTVQGQGAASSQVGHCTHATITLNASPEYTDAKSYQLKGRLTCGGSGLAGKTVILTNSTELNVGKFASVVTGPDGTYTATTTNPQPGLPLSTLSVWYFGGHNDGDVANKIITLKHCTHVRSLCNYPLDGIICCPQ